MTHETARLLNRYQQKGESPQKFNSKCSEVIQAVADSDPSQIMDPFKIINQKLLYPVISSKTIHSSHLTFQ